MLPSSVGLELLVLARCFWVRSFPVLIVVIIVIVILIVVVIGVNDLAVVETGVQFQIAA